MGKEFSLANPTAPSAEAAPTPPPGPAPAPTSRRPDVPTSREPSERRNAFTWRQTEEQQDDLDDLTRAVRRASGRRVDKADVLASLVKLAKDYDSVRRTLIETLGSPDA